MGRITMKHLSLFLLTLTLNSFSLAEFEIPNEFEDGQVTSASQMNENFQALKAELNAQRALLEANLGSQNAVFQGFSSNTVDGAAGLVAMQQACNNFSSGSHVCTTSEFAQSSYNETAFVDLQDGDTAWLLINIGGSADGSYSGTVDSIEINGLTSTSSRNTYANGSCWGWTDNNSSTYGLVVSPSGSISSTSCSNSRPVACCK